MENYKFPDNKKVFFLNDEEARNELLKDQILPFFNCLTNLDLTARMNIPFNENVHSLNLHYFK